MALTNAVLCTYVASGSIAYPNQKWTGQKYAAEAGAMCIVQLKNRPP